MGNINIAHSEFPEQHGGLMICGYEWGYSKEDERNDALGVEQPVNHDAGCTFANKVLCYGPRALKWRYDNIIMKWFGLWGHPLSRSEPMSFERSIVQTNWCNTQAHAMDGDYSKLSEPEQIDNFIGHIDYFKPRVILFMGSRLIDALQGPAVRERFEAITGKCTKEASAQQKKFAGRRFKFVFQSFERCEVVGLPHPSSSHGISDDYITLFNDEMGSLLQRFKLGTA